MDYENISFREALSKVASMAGISIDIGDIREKSNPYQKCMKHMILLLNFIKII